MASAGHDPTANEDRVIDIRRFFPTNGRNAMSAQARRKEKTQRAGPSEAASPVEEAPVSRGIRLRGKIFESWKLWCRVHGMTYEESIAYLLEKHPVKLDDLRKAYKGVE